MMIAYDVSTCLSTCSLAINEIKRRDLDSELINVREMLQTVCRTLESQVSRLGSTWIRVGEV